METFARMVEGSELLQWKFEGDQIVRRWQSVSEDAIREENAGIRRTVSASLN